MLVPPLAHRREIDRKLAEFFHQQRPAMFRRAVAEFCRFYAVKAPRIEWYEYIDWGKAAGKTFEDGRIHLVHPENWQRGRVYKSERMWVQTVYHELAHYLFWTDAERKAEVFTRRMVRGLRGAVRAARSRTVVRRAVDAARASSGRSRRDGTGRSAAKSLRTSRGRRSAPRAPLSRRRRTG